jgi:hypothetical protein
MLAWTNEQKVLARTCATLLNEVTAFYTQSLSQLQEDSFSADWKELERKRAATLKQTRKALAGFKLDVRTIQGKQQASKVDPAAVAALFENFETKVTAYKSAMRRDFDVLVRDFATTTEELRVCLENSSANAKTEGGDDSFESEDLQSEAALAKDKERKQQLDRNLQMQTQVGLLDRKVLDLGGRYGKWDPRDHDVFLRLWNQAAGASRPKKQLLIKKLQMQLADKTDVECAEHYDWYIEYNALLEQKKKLLADWKGSSLSDKEKQRRAILAGANKVGVQAGDDDCGDDADKSADRATAAIHHRDHSEAEKELMREQVERWRKAKAEEQRIKEQAEREEELREKQRRDDKLRKRQQETRLQIEKWRADEAHIKQMDTLNGGGHSPRRNKSGSASTQADIELSAARDYEFALRRREEREAKEKRSVAREQRLRDLEGKLASAPAASRDPKRLLADTVATGASRKTVEQLDEAERKRSGLGAHSSNMALSGRDLVQGGMRRATPAWIARPQI